MFSNSDIGFYLLVIPALLWQLCLIRRLAKDLAKTQAQAKERRAKWEDDDKRLAALEKAAGITSYRTPV